MALRALLYSADEPDRELASLDGLERSSLDARQILWLDLCDPGAGERERLASWLGCDPRLFGLDTGRRERPSLANFGDIFRVTAVSVVLDGSQAMIGRDHLTLVAGRNVVVTVHARPVAFLDELRDREKGDTGIGALAPESFAASLLDRLLDSYFGAVEALVRDIDRVEVALLGKRKSPQFLDLLVAARKRVGELRRLLKTHRDVFYGMGRPDFMATEQPEAKPHFDALERRFERAEDEVEGARELVIGSFELLSARAAQAMNETIQTLTFVTVMMGVLALIAGLMGMNFHMAFFDTGAVGFYTVVAVMVVLAGFGTLLAWRRGWLYRDVAHEPAASASTLPPRT